MELAIILCLAYLVGAIPSGVVLTRLAGADDVRSAGSGNIGATNVYRVAGKRLGILTLVADMLKGVLPLLALKLWSAQDEQTLALVAVMLFVGHCYPVYLKFKGGKGVATALGVFLVLSPLAILVAVVVFAGVLWRWWYVSLASICAAAVVPFMVYAFEQSIPLFLASLVISGGIICRHSANIERLRNGTENRFKK
ncbi:MAG: glycerol-3-phosphate acyltransferase [Desulfuromonas sp.]|nr:glycerol-3-phosphate acyltransferase [Desulfuromonas sp.]